MEIDKNLSTELKNLVKNNRDLKEMLENTDKAKVEEIIKNIDFSKVDMQEVTKKLRKENPENIADKLKIMINKYFGGNNG